MIWNVSWGQLPAAVDVELDPGVGVVEDDLEQPWLVRLFSGIFPWKKWYNDWKKQNDSWRKLDFPILVICAVPNLI